MALPSVTYTFTNSTVADGPQVSTNFSDLISSLTGATADVSFLTLTVSSTTTLSGSSVIGASSANTVTINALLASDVVPSANAARTLGSASKGFVGLYVDNSATDGGGVYFDNSASKYVKATAAGTQLDVSGLTNFALQSMSFDVVNSGSKFKVSNAGKLQYGAANVSDWLINVGLSLSAGTLSIVDATGAALSSSNPAYVTLPSAATDGAFVSYTLSSGNAFIDDNGSSNIIGNLFGTTTGVAWGSDCPFYIYAVAKSDDSAVAFALSRLPHLTVSPESGVNGSTSSAAADYDASFFFWSGVTIADYSGTPCRRIGCIRMQKSTSDDWTVQTLDTSKGDGIGGSYQLAQFTFPTLNNSATSGHLSTSTGTVPVFTENNVKYVLNDDGMVQCRIELYGDGGTDGSGAGILKVALPLMAEDAGTGGNVYAPLGFGFATGAASAGHIMLTNYQSGDLVTVGSKSMITKLAMQDIPAANGTAVLNTRFTNGVRAIYATVNYPAYRVSRL